MSSKKHNKETRKRINNEATKGREGVTKR